ncbi:MAG: hypothetical protein NT160_02300 [Actinobacteria bacterium]|jgi:hypothetical protein|nr:hypothetical protein [Actinomycetota bacterium]
MEKLMYVLWFPEDLGPQALGEKLRLEVAPRLLDLKVLGLTMDIDDEWADVKPPVPAPAGEVLPRAIVSVWVKAYDWRAPLEAVLAECSERLLCYEVVESLYSDYGDSPWAEVRNWDDGERSPGILTVALFPQKRGTVFEEWLRFWHDQQSPMSEAIQPRCRYVRNAVFQSLTEGAPAWRAIVEEAWPSKEAVQDPMQFFCADGDADLLTANVTTMLEHGDKLFDMEDLRSLTLSEWIMKTPGRP